MIYKYDEMDNNNIIMLFVVFSFPSGQLWK